MNARTIKTIKEEMELSYSELKISSNFLYRSYRCIVLIVVSCKSLICKLLYLIN
jgi:hypothetical protein